MNPAEQRDRTAMVSALREIAQRLHMSLGESVVRGDYETRIAGMLAVSIHDGVFAALALSGTRGESQLATLTRTTIEALADLLICLADEQHLQKIRLRSAEQAAKFWRDAAELSQLADDLA